MGTVDSHNEILYMGPEVSGSCSDWRGILESDVMAGSPFCNTLLKLIGHLTLWGEN